MQSILGAVEDHSLCSSHLSQQVVHHLKKPKCKKPRRKDRACLEKYTDSPATAASETHIIVCPQLQTAGADAEHAGEELLRFKEVGYVKVLRQAWKLFAEVSRFLQERRESACSKDIFFIFAEMYQKNRSSGSILCEIESPLRTFRTSSPSDRR